VRYHVVGAERLAPGEVEVKFGHAVYLPAPTEKVQYTVAVSRDSAVWKTVCAIYPNQRLTLIGNDEHGATHAAPGWPFGAEGAVLMINDGPDTPLEIQVRPKEMFECGFDAAKGYYTIRSRRGAVDGAGLPLRLLLRITPAASGQTGARSQPSPRPQMCLRPHAPTHPPARPCPRARPCRPLPRAGPPSGSRAPTPPTSPGCNPPSRLPHRSRPPSKRAPAT
jgi:hypothetical protein